MSGVEVLDRGSEVVDGEEREVVATVSRGRVEDLVFEGRGRGFFATGWEMMRVTVGRGLMPHFLLPQRLIMNM